MNKAEHIYTIYAQDDGCGNREITSRFSGLRLHLTWMYTSLRSVTVAEAFPCFNMV